MSVLIFPYIKWRDLSDLRLLRGRNKTSTIKACYRLTLRGQLLVCFAVLSGVL